MMRGGGVIVRLIERGSGDEIRNYGPIYDDFRATSFDGTVVLSTTGDGRTSVYFATSTIFNSSYRSDLDIMKIGCR